MDEQLQHWVEEQAGGRVVATDRPPSGGSRELYLVDVETGAGATIPLVLRCEAGGSFTGTVISLAREAAFYRALEGTDVPVPRVVGLAEGGEALLLERIPGTADMAGINDDERSEVMGSFIDAMAALHSLDVEDLQLPGVARPASPEDNARLDLEMWAGLARDGVDELDPMVRFAGAWLYANAPTEVERTVLVQGDTGPGNFLFEHGRVTGIVDWEFAHLGDPMDDWAWLDMRARGEVSDEMLERYTARTGIVIDQAKIDYYRAAVDYRCAITTSLAVSRGGGARGWAPYLLVTERYVTDLTRRMSDLMGVAETVELPDIVPTPRTGHYDTLLDGIRTAVRATEDVELREQTRNLQILVHYLRAFDEVGAELEDLDRRDREAALGPASSDRSEFQRIVEEAAASGDEAVFSYLLRYRARRKLLWSTLLERPRR